MATTKRQTMGKMNRERELREKRELKQARKDEKKLAAAAAAVIEAEAPVADPSTEPLSILTDTVSGDAASA
jgi:hypothetical protein